MGSFAANSGSSATTSADDSEDEHIEGKGKLFLRPVLLRSFLASVLLKYSLRLAARVIRHAVVFSLKKIFPFSALYRRFLSFVPVF